MKPKVYLETTIPSLLVARPSQQAIVAANQEITKEWWQTRREQFELYVSELVIEESRQGDPQFAAARLKAMDECTVLTAIDEAQVLGDSILAAGLVPAKATADAFHIAIAAVHQMDFLLTWNCRHIANAMIATRLREVCEAAGCRLPVLCTPFELMIG